MRSHIIYPVNRKDYSRERVLMNMLLRRVAKELPFVPSNKVSLIYYI